MQVLFFPKNNKICCTIIWQVRVCKHVFQVFFVRRPQRCIFSISLNIGELKHTRILRNLCCLTGVKSGFERLDLNFPSLLKKPLSLKNIEHALCEFDKYFRFIITKSEKGREYSEKKSRSYLDKKPCCQYCSNEASKAPIISLCLGICSKGIDNHDF